MFWRRFRSISKKYPNINYLSNVIEHDCRQHVIRFYDLDGHIIKVRENMKIVIQRFLDSEMSIEAIPLKMDASIESLTKLLNDYLKVFIFS